MDKTGRQTAKKGKIRKKKPAYGKAEKPVFSHDLTRQSREYGFYQKPHHESRITSFKVKDLKKKSPPFMVRKRRAVLTSVLIISLIIGTGFVVLDHGYKTSAANITWDGGGGDANWNTALNWSTDTVPTSTDVAVFNSTCVSNCSPTMNINVNLTGIDMQSTYTGTITQSAGLTLTVGSSNWTQAGGNFIGGNSTNTVNGSYTLSGGVATSTSGTLDIRNNFTISSGTFNHNNGIVESFVTGIAQSATITCSG